MWQVRRVGRYARGLTIVELAIVMLLLGVLVTLAAPEFRLMWANSRVTGYAPQLAEFFAFARSTAVFERRDIDVVQVAGGWQVKRAGTEVVLKSFSYANSDNIAETLTTQPAGLGGGVFRYASTGFFWHVNGAVLTPAQLSIALCVNVVDGEQGRTIEIRRTGQVRTFRSTIECPV